MRFIKDERFIGPFINHQEGVIFTDLRGRGGSFRPQNEAKPSSFPEFTEKPPDWDWGKYSNWLKTEVNKLVRPNETKNEK